MLGGSSWEWDVTQLPWATETRAAHLHAIPIPRHSPKCLEEGFSLLSRNWQFGNVLFFFPFPEVSPGLLSKLDNLPLPLFLPAYGSLCPLPSPSRAPQLILLRILFHQVCHCNTLCNKPSRGGRRFRSSTLVVEESSPDPSPPSLVGVCVDKSRGSRDLFLAEPTCPRSGDAPFPLFQKLQFPEQGWLPRKHHLHTSPSSLQPPSFSC